MPSNSNRKSDSSARSTGRKRVHLGTGTASRRASAYPEAHVEVEASGKRSTVGSVKMRKEAEPARQRPSRPPSAKQVERLRKRAVQRRRLLLQGAAVAAAVAAIWVGWAALASSQLFEIRDLKVEGNSRLSDEEVLSLAALQPDETLLRIDEDDVRARLTASPWVAAADLSRGFPSTLRIEIRERVPMALVDTGVTFWFIDGDGRILTETVPETSTVLPVVRDIPDFVAEPGTMSDSDALQNALAVLRGLDPDIVATVKVVSAPSENETALLTAGSVEIMIGEATQLDEKSILISDILSERGADVVFIDVRSVERPVSRGLGQ